MKYMIVKDATGVDDERNPTAILYNAYGVLSEHDLATRSDDPPIVVETHATAEEAVERLVRMVRFQPVPDEKFIDMSLCSLETWVMIRDRTPV